MADLSACDSAIKFGMGRFRLERGLLEQLGEEIAAFGKRLLVIAGERSWKAVEDRLAPSLEGAGIEWDLVIWTGACSAKGARELAERARQFGANEVVGVGGGKNIDLAKAVGEVAGLGVVLLPTNIAQCAPGACTSVMYTPEGGKDVTWRYTHEVDGCYMDLDVIAACPIRYTAAGILDAMAKKIEILNGRPSIDLETTDVDLFTAYQLAIYTFDALTRYGEQAIDDNRRSEATKALNDIAFINVAVTGVISNFTRGYNQTQIAHVIYDGVRTMFTQEAANALHGEIVAVGLFCQLYFNKLQEEESELRDMLRFMDMPMNLAALGIEPTEENLTKIEDYIVGSRHYNSDDPADRQRLHEAIREMV